ncbi:MAG: extracellular solute-binding protein [Propionibacteriaceae bacterium]|nr:extracellular solute-binding protein [Propionibacteriaceae bacterium]
MSNIRKALAWAGAAALTVGLAACTPPGGNQTETSAPAPTTTSNPSEKFDPATAGDVTLKLWDWWGANEGVWIDAMIQQFQTTYPNIKIERTQVDWGQLTSTLNLKITEPDGPDIATANNGWQSLGTLAAAGSIVNLDSYAAQYGWNDLIPSTIAQQNQFTTDGKGIGSGSLFGTPIARVQPIGVYFNVAKLQQLGISPPTTLDEFQAALQKAKDAGEIPLAYNSLDGATAPLLGVQALHGTAEAINSFVWGDTSVTAGQTGMTEAAQTLKEWNDKGFFTPQHEGIDYQTAVADFVAGKGVFRFEYQGSLGLAKEQQGDFGYIQLPNVNGGVVGVGASPASMVISSKTESPDVAAAFLDFLMSKEAAQAAVDNGLIPLLHEDVTVPTDMPLFQMEISEIAKIGASNGYVPYFDWASPTMLDTLSQQLQLMYAGKATPQELVTAVDTDRDAFLAQQ